MESTSRQQGWQTMLALKFPPQFFDGETDPPASHKPTP